MAEYIDKDKVHKRLTLLEMKLIEEEGYYDRFTKGFGECMWHVANFPAADVVSRETYEAVQKALIAFAETDVVALPVKYGQTLWRIDGNGFRSPEFQKAVPVTVQEIVFKDVRGKPQWSFIASSTMFSFGGIGKTVFLTKEEAEKVIAKRRANNG